MFRYRRSIKQYRSAPRVKHCPFCDTTGQGEIVEETPHAYVMQNKFGYDLWEFRNVTEHLMVIPKRHVQSLEDLNPQERKEIINIIAEYEAKNYNVYARAVNSVQRTVPMHQHTHLIKTDDVPARGSFFLRKPYFLYKF